MAGRSDVCRPAGRPRCLTYMVLRRRHRYVISSQTETETNFSVRIKKNGNGSSVYEIILLVIVDTFYLIGYLLFS